jgi:nitrogen fixation negative regulator NifL
MAFIVLIPLAMMSTPSELNELAAGRRRFIPAAVVLVLGITLSITAFTIVRGLEDSKVQSDFEQKASRMAAVLKRSVDVTLDDVNSVADFLKVSRRVEAEQFRSFAAPMLQRHRALQSLLWTQRVTDSARSAYEAEIRATRAPGFQIFERDGQGHPVRAGSRPEYFVAHYRASIVEPDARKVLGFDVGSDFVMRDALARARDTGNLVVSGRFITLSSSGQESGFLALVPLYRAGVLLDTIEARRTNLLGFAQGVFNTRHLVEQSWAGVQLPGVNALLIDQSADETEPILYFHPAASLDTVPPRVEAVPAIRAGMHFGTTIVVGERQWGILFYPSDAYLLASARRHQSWGLLGGGLLVTGALVAYLLLAARASRVERLVAMRTAELSASNEALQREISANRFQQAAFQATADGMVITNRSGEIQWVNPAFSRITGWPAAEAIGQTPRILKSGAHDAAFYRSLWATLLSGSTWRGEVINRRKDGTRYTEQQTITPVTAEDGTITGFVGVKHDVSEQRRLAETLRQQEAHYRSLIENIQDVVYVVDQEGIIRYASPSIERALGYTPRERVGRPALELIHPDDLPNVARAFAQVSGRSNLLGSAQYRVKHRDGAWRVVEAVGKNLSEREVAKGMVLTVRDITERQAAEELQQKLTGQLAQREKLAALGELLAGVAHELNNPLSVVIGHAVLLERAADPKVRERGTKLNDAATRCARIVKNFLALARQHAPERARVDVNALVREVVELLAYQLRMDNVTVTLDLSDRVPSLWADPHQLRQVLVNLITNAHHAVRETPADRHVDVSTRFDADKLMLQLEVRDSGRGISREVEARIFEPFFTTKPLGQGTGLGLPICKGIVESHGGLLEVEGRPGTGALFRIWVPQGSEPQGAGADKVQPARRGRGERVLVVDDEVEVANLLAEMLSSAGYRVDTAENGRVAIGKLAEKPYDVVVSDLKMPVLDGPGFYREVAARDSNALQKFAFITGDTLGPSTARFLEDTPAPHLSKPFRVEEVEAVVARILEGATVSAAMEDV